jgi:hypothetical protein
MMTQLLKWGGLIILASVGAVYYFYNKKCKSRRNMPAEVKFLMISSDSSSDSSSSEEIVEPVHQQELDNAKEPEIIEAIIVPELQDPESESGSESTSTSTSISTSVSKSESVNTFEPDCQFTSPAEEILN